MNTISCYNDFLAALFEAGFSMGGDNDEGIFSLNNRFGENIQWHTGDSETDPWDWHFRVFSERNDIANAKLFFNKTGYITREYYPYFLAVRRGLSFDEAYESGNMSTWEKRIYDHIRKTGRAAYHNIKTDTGFTTEDKLGFEKAIVSLQMKLYITACGREHKRSQSGEPYGWPSVVFCTTEEFWGERIFNEAAGISKADAFDAITMQILRLNPQALKKKIEKFING